MAPVPVASESASELAVQEIEELVKVLSHIFLFWQLEFFGWDCRFRKSGTASTPYSLFAGGFSRPEQLSPRSSAGKKPFLHQDLCNRLNV